METSRQLRYNRTVPRYFAYGSNMASERLIARVGGVEVVGAALLRLYRHAFSKHGADGTAKGNIEPDEDDRVWGVVYELSTGQLEELDAIEGGYRRIDVTVDCDGEQLDTITYIAISPRRGLTPTAEYLDLYERGIREHAISPAYWESIRPGQQFFSWVIAVELCAFVGIGVFEFQFPREALLLVVASSSLWIRGRSWLEAGLRAPRGWLVLATAGLLAGAVAQFAITAVVGANIDDAALSQAGLTALVMVLLVHLAAAFAAEMVFRGYLIERLRDVLGNETAALAIAAAVFAWVVAGTDPGAFVGALAAGLGYGLLYVASKRALTLPIAVHAGFELTGVLLGVSL